MKSINLGKITKIKTGKLNANQATEDGVYPFFTCSTAISRIDQYAYDCECVLVAGNGDLNIKYYNGKFNAYQRVYILESIDKDKFNVKFLYYFLQTYIKTLRKNSIGGVIKYIRLQDLTNAKLPNITIENQKKIVEVLEKSEELISKRQQQIEALSDLKQSIFLDMFGDPNNNNKNWDELTFKDIVTFHNELRVPIKKQDRGKIQGEYPYYGATGIVDYINDYKFEGEYLLISEDGKALFHRNKPIVFIAKGQFWVNNHAHVISTTNKSTLIYLERCIELLDISNYITGIDQYKLNRNNLSKIKIPLPPIDLQIEYEEKVMKINKQIKQISISLKQINNLYNSLLQKAFNGELFNEESIEV